MSTELRKALEEAKEVISDLKERLAAASEMSDPGVVMAVTKVGVTVMTQSGPVPVRNPSNLPMKVGDHVMVIGKLLVNVFHPPMYGEVVTVTESSGDHFEFSANGALHRGVCTGRELKPGDRVVVDFSGNIAIGVLPAIKKNAVVQETGVAWNDVGGHTEAKKALIEAIELPYKNPELFKAYGKDPVKGVLLHGPAGCGKTMLAKATATSLAEVHGKKTETGFIYVKGPELLNMYVGESEAAVRELFARARKHKAEHGFPAVIFIDEADAVLGVRGESQHGLRDTIVPQFLAEMDGFDTNDAVVLLATNLPTGLDPAVVRDGRIDRKVYVGRPSKEDALGIFEMYSKKRVLQKGLTTAQLSAHGAEELFDKSKVLHKVVTDTETIPFTLGDVANGAMIRGLVDQATNIALQRDIEAQQKKPSGVSLEDVSAAAALVFQQNKVLNHNEDLKIFTRPFKSRVKDIIQVGA